jgi:hypothetical protein
VLVVGVLSAMPYNRANFRKHADEHWNKDVPGLRDHRFEYYPCQNCAELTHGPLKANGKIAQKRMLMVR